MFDYSGLAKELNASIEEESNTRFTNALVRRKFKVTINEVNFSFFAKDDSHYEVKEGMIRFSVCSHAVDKYGQSHYMDNVPSVNVSAKKSFAQAAADIRRRLLNPETIEQIRKFHESIRRTEERTDAIIQKMEKVAQLIQSSESIGPDTGKIWTGSKFPVQFTVSNWLDNFVRVGDMTLTIEQLEKVCKALL